MNKKNSVYVLGSINVDLTIKVMRMPLLGETILGSDFFTNVGGKGFNQANATASLGLDSYLIGAIGTDQFAGRIQQVIAEKQINSSGIITKDTSSGLAIVIRNDYDNVIILHGGANLLLEQNDCKLINNGQKGDLLIAQLEIPLETVINGFKMAKDKKMITILNPSPALMLPDQLYMQTDYIVLNQTEAQILTGIYPDTDNKIRESGNFLLNKGVLNVIITLGSGGCAYLNGNVFFKKSAVATKVVDTTGAGDSFIGGLAYALINNYSIEKTIEFANATAGYTCGINGVENAMPTIDKIKI